ncbi:MAG TPA: D-2-hydroxyacid dehydrogenase family protein [Pseudolabrys sp.]|nr:D-2-hydroxyacid dehydrogenase family protein [Pseudolabrys sp.]
MAYRGAILDDYQNVVLKTADWSGVTKDIDFTVFNEPILGGPDKVVAALKDFEIVCLMRERTLFRADVINALPKLKLILTSGMRNAAIDVNAAAERGIPVCGTESLGHPTAELTFGLMLELTRHIGYENARMKAGQKWQITIGEDLNGKTLGILGLGKLGSRVAKVGKAFGMKVIAWSQNLTAEKAAEAGATLVSKEELFKQSDFVTVHLQLSGRTKGLVGAAELGLMKPTAYFINTSRGPIADEKAIEAALRGKKIKGAALDVYDVEPLALDHPFRKLDNLITTPHLGYVTAENYKGYFVQFVEDLRAWLDGKPVRVIPAK